MVSAEAAEVGGELLLMDQVGEGSFHFKKEKKSSGNGWRWCCCNMWIYLIPLDWTLQMIDQEKKSLLPPPSHPDPSDNLYLVEISFCYYYSVINLFHVYLFEVSLSLSPPHTIHNLVFILSDRTWNPPQLLCRVTAEGCGVCGLKFFFFFLDWNSCSAQGSLTLCLRVNYLPSLCHFLQLENGCCCCCCCCC